jgi:hypothetical protein
VSLIGVALGVGLSEAFQVTEWVKVIPPSGFQPPAVVILASAPARAQVCAEVERGLTACRGVDEFRVWVRERPKK